MKLEKRKLVGAIIIASAVVSCTWWIVDRPTSRPQVFQNCRSKVEGRVCFTLTNPTTISYDYWVLTEFESNQVWNIFPTVQVMHSEDQKELPPHQAVTISVSPPNHSGKWRVAALCRRSPTAPATLATRVRDFLNDWNMGWVAAQLEIYDKGILVPGPEMPSGK